MSSAVSSASTRLSGSFGRLSKRQGVERPGLDRSANALARRLESPVAGRAGVEPSAKASRLVSGGGSRLAGHPHRRDCGTGVASLAPRPVSEPALDKLLPAAAEHHTGHEPGDIGAIRPPGNGAGGAAFAAGGPHPGLPFPRACVEALQAVCDEADALLDEPMAAGQSRQRLIEPYLRNALCSGPKAAPWNKAGALRFLCLTGLVAAGLAFLAVREEIAWERAVAKLDAEPGIRVAGVEVRCGVPARRGPARWHVGGAGGRVAQPGPPAGPCGIQPGHRGVSRAPGG